MARLLAPVGCLNRPFLLINVISVILAAANTATINVTSTTILLLLLLLIAFKFIY